MMKLAGRRPVLWIGGAVIGAHLLFLAFVWNRRVLPRLPPPPATPLPVNFAVRHTQHLDPRTGEPQRETEFTVDTQLATPAPTNSPVQEPARHRFLP